MKNQGDKIYQTANGFYNIQTKRYNTLPSNRNNIRTSLHTHLVRANQNKEKLFTQMKSILNQAPNRLLNATSQHKIVPSQGEPVHKNQMVQEDDEHLTNDFVNQWSRMTVLKEKTYRRFRNQIVQQYPSMRKHYSTDDMNEASKAKSTPPATEKKKQQNKNRQTISRNQRYKKMYFYSRSKKKCMSNIIINDIQLKEKGYSILPKLNYLEYRRGRTDKGKLKNKKLKGLGLIKKREKIMELEKQGTKSYNTLKKCLDEAIDQCIQ